MSDYKSFISDLLEKDEALKNEVEFLELKYSIINELVTYRKENNLTQAQFAESINVKQQAISRFEKGEIDARISFIAKVVIGMKKKVVFSDLEAVQVEKTITRKKKKIDMLKTSWISLFTMSRKAKWVEKLDTSTHLW